MGAPDSLDGTDAEPRRLRHQGAVQWVVSPGGSPSVRATTRVAASPPDASLGFARASHDLVGADPIGGEQNDLSPPNVFLGSVAIFVESLELPPISRRNGHGFSRAHRADSHAPPKTGIPKGTQSSDFIH